MLDWLISLVAAFVKNEGFFFLAAVEFSRPIRKETLPFLSWDLPNVMRDVVLSRVPADDPEKQGGIRARCHVRPRVDGG